MDNFLSKLKEKPQILVIFVVNITIISVVLSYLMKAKACNCDLKSSHNKVKITAILSLVLSCILFIHTLYPNILVSDTLGFITKIKRTLIITLCLVCVALVVNGIYSVSLFKYVKHVKETNCPCTTTTIKHSHKFLNLWRYVVVIAFGAQVLGSIYLASKYKTFKKILSLPEN